jgi:DNA replication and repair protein RecF
VSQDTCGKVVVITGQNGAGKTSILEALHYACYTRSFKTSTPSDLIRMPESESEEQSTQGFAISLSVSSQMKNDELVSMPEQDILSISCVRKKTGFKNTYKKIYKKNGNQVTSYNDVYDIYKVVTIAEDNLDLIKGSPSSRRSFIDQFISINEPSYIHTLKKYKHILKSRNALLLSHRFNYDSYVIWTQQLIACSEEIQKKRIHYISMLNDTLFATLSEYTEDKSSIVMHYKRAKTYVYDDHSTETHVNTFMSRCGDLIEKEKRQRRTLFGSHLDDFTIFLNGKDTRVYSSRGQQKFVLIMITASKLRIMNQSAILLVDDFTTDLDTQKSLTLLRLLVRLSEQIFITSAVENKSIDIISKDNSSVHIYI